MTKKTVSKNRDKAQLLRAPHRATRAVVRLEGAPEVRALYALFANYNRTYFRRRLAEPMVMVGNTGRAWGDYSARDAHGLRSRINVGVKAVKRGELFAADVLLHEMVHAWMHEVENADESGYRGHGPLFAATCNRIGAKLGLGPVGVKGRDGLPDCAYWPMSVRPEGYYPDEFKAPTRGKGESEGGDGDELDDDDDRDAADELPKLSARAVLGLPIVVELLDEHLKHWKPESANERQEKSFVGATRDYLSKLADKVEGRGSKSAKCDPRQAEMFS